MSKPRLTQISALPDGRYELVFTAGDSRMVFECGVDDRSGIPLVSPEPWLLPTKPDNDAPDIENRRAVIEAVVAMHRAYQG
jgi:hypothetical protein